MQFRNVDGKSRDWVERKLTLPARLCPKREIYREKCALSNNRVGGGIPVSRSYNARLRSHLHITFVAAFSIPIFFNNAAAMTSADAPLLSDYDHQLEENATETLNGHSPSPKSSRNSEFTNRFRNHWSRWKVIYACALFIFILDFPSFMRVAPFLRLIELGVCRDYYQKVDPSVIAPNGDIDESLCKLDVIQSELANMRGLLGSVESLPGI